MVNNESLYTPEQQSTLLSLDSFEISGDPIADMKSFDLITNQGHLIHRYDTPERALRFLISRSEILSEDPPSTTFGGVFRQHQKMVLHRLLNHYQLQGFSIDEYDDRQEQIEGSYSMTQKHGVEFFKPSGTLRNDLLVFAAITKNRLLSRQLAEGHDPLEVAKEQRTWLASMLRSGVTEGHTPETRFWLTNTAPLELALLDQLLTAHS